MTDASDIRSRLNVRGEMEIGECGSLDEAVLWCYRHDLHPIAPWPDSPRDPDFDVKVRFALPLLEDYLGLILKGAEAIDIPGYARTLYPRIIAESGAIDRYPDGSLRPEGIREHLKRFRSPNFDIDLRDQDISAYPFPDFNIDVCEIAENPPKYVTDDRSRYLASMFESFFRKTCSLARLEKYTSHDDPVYIMHGGSISLSVRSFVMSNSTIPAGKKNELGYGLEQWAGWATMILRPRVVGEEF